MYNKNQQLFIAIEPTSNKDDPITLMEFNKKDKLVGITEKNYYSSFKLKLPNYIHFEEYEPTYDLFLIKPKANPVFVKHTKEKIIRNEISKLLY